MTKTVIAVLVAGVVAVLGLLAWSFWALGGKTEEVKTVKATATATEKVQEKAKAKTRTDLGRAAATGRAREQDRAALDAFFQQLEREANHAPTAAADSYVLPDERLRLWRDANAGRSDRGEAGGQPDGGAPAIAATAHGPDSGPGGQPSRRGEGLPPTRVADVPAAGLPATANGGL